MPHHQYLDRFADAVHEDIVGVDDRLARAGHPTGAVDQRVVGQAVSGVADGIADPLSGSRISVSLAKSSYHKVAREMGFENSSRQYSSYSPQPTQARTSSPETSQKESDAPSVESPLISAVHTSEEAQTTAVDPQKDKVAADTAQIQAIASALDSGNDQNWAAGDSNGKVSVKDANASGFDLCRKYKVVRDENASGYATVCKASNGGWVTPD